MVFTSSQLFLVWNHGISVAYCSHRYYIFSNYQWSSSAFSFFMHNISEAVNANEALNWVRSRHFCYVNIVLTRAQESCTRINPSFVKNLSKYNFYWPIGFRAAWSRPTFTCFFCQGYKKHFSSVNSYIPKIAGKNFNSIRL